MGTMVNNMEYQVQRSYELMAAQMEHRMREMMMEFAQGYSIQQQTQGQITEKRMEEMMNDMREKMLKQEAMSQIVMNSMQAAGIRSEGPMGESVMDIQSEAGCDCQLQAEQLTVMKEGPRKGRKFWKCRQRICSFFLWDPVEVYQMMPPAVKARFPAPPRTSPPRSNASASWEPVNASVAAPSGTGVVDLTEF